MPDLEDLRTQARAALDLPSPAVLKATREAAGVSRAQLAKVVGVSDMSIYYYETGERTPTGEHRTNLIKAIAVLREEVTR
jgi:predicted transcriptional regulator